jgi:hypothetical protein
VDTGTQGDEQAADDGAELVTIGGKQWRLEWSPGAISRLCKKYGPIVQPGVGVVWNMTNVGMLFDVLGEAIQPQRQKATPPAWFEARVKTAELWDLAGKVQDAICVAVGITSKAPKVEEGDDAGESTSASSTPAGGSSSPATSD